MGKNKRHGWLSLTGFIETCEIGATIKALILGLQQGQAGRAEFRLARGTLWEAVADPQTGQVTLSAVLN